METHRNGQTFTNMDELLESVYSLLNSRNVGNGPQDPPVAILVQTTGNYINNEADMKVTVFEGFTSDKEIADELLGLEPAAVPEGPAPQEAKAPGGWGQGARK